MLNIAIVDDEINDFELLSSMIKKYCHDNDMSFKITGFHNGIEFLENYKPSFNLIFMDIDMPHIDGMKTAKQLRKIDDKVQLVFVTKLAKFAINGYEVDAISFIIKPFTYFMVENCLAKASHKIQQASNHVIILAIDSVMKKIPVDEITYIEVSNHFSIFHGFFGEIKVRKTLKSIESELGNAGFSRCNSCYLVNMKYIEKITTDEVIVNGISLVISRSKRKQFLEDVTNYYGDNQ